MVPRHSSEFATRFGHVQVERDYDSAYAFFLKLFKIVFFKNVLSAILYLNSIPAVNVLGTHPNEIRQGFWLLNHIHIKN